jgi:tRNA-dihydrouridine synthase
LPTDFQKLLQSDAPILALAPMQDVTDLRFMRLIAGYGNADLYFTEYFRVLPTRGSTRTSSTPSRKTRPAARSSPR